MRGIRSGQENDDIDVLPGQSTTTPLSGTDLPIPLSIDADKPRRKPVRRKPKSKLVETFPPYLQEAFFGKDLMDCSKDLDSSSSDEEKVFSDMAKTIQLTQDEIKAVAAVSAKQEKSDTMIDSKDSLGVLLDKNIVHKIEQRPQSHVLVPKVEDDSTAEDLKDVLTLPGDLLDTDLVNTIMNETDDELSKNNESLDALGGSNNIIVRF